MEAVDRVASAGAPVLIGFVSGLIGLVVANEEDVAWPDATLAALTLSALALVITILAYLEARPHLLSREDVANITVAGKADDERTKNSVLEENESYRRWAKLSRRSFLIGLSFLLVGIAGALFPPEKLCANPFRLAAVGIALVGSVLDLAYAATGDRKETAGREQLEELLAKLATENGPGQADNIPGRGEDAGDR